MDDDRALGTAGDAAVGAQVYAENGCAACHGDDGSGGPAENIRNTSAHELAEVLWKGEDEGEDHDEEMEHEDDDEGEHDGGEMGMPAFPELVPYAADLAAFLSGAAPADTGGQTPPTDTGTQPPPQTGGSAPAALGSICLGCHGDNSAKVSCGNGKWLAHDGTRVSASVFDEVSTWATGGVCSTGGGGGGTTTPPSTGGGTTPPQTGGGTPATPPAALGSICLGCHGDNSAKVSCGNGKWLAHDGTRVSASVFDEVSTWATGGVCP